MLKKCILALALLLSAACFSIQATANTDLTDIEIDDALSAALMAEPPLTQADLDKFIRYSHELDQAAESGDNAAVQNILKAAEWTETRMIYVVFKIGYTCVMLEDPETEAFFEAFFPEFMPSTDERTLIEHKLNKVSPLIKAD